MDLFINSHRPEQSGRGFQNSNPMQQSWSQLLQQAKIKDAEKHEEKPEPATFEQLFQIEMLLKTCDLQLERKWEIDGEFLEYDFEEAEETITTLRQNQLPKTPAYGFAQKMTELGKAVEISVKNPKS